MKKLFLTVALVGGMLSFAAMNNGNTTEPVIQTKTVVVAEEAELPTSYCIDKVFEMDANDQLSYEMFNMFVMFCEAL